MNRENYQKLNSIFCKIILDRVYKEIDCILKKNIFICSYKLFLLYSYQIV